MPSSRLFINNATPQRYAFSADTDADARRFEALLRCAGVACAIESADDACDDALDCTLVVLSVFADPELELHRLKSIARGAPRLDSVANSLSMLPYDDGGGGIACK